MMSDNFCIVCKVPTVYRAQEYSCGHGICVTHQVDYPSCPFCINSATAIPPPPPPYFAKQQLGTYIKGAKLSVNYDTTTIFLDYFAPVDGYGESFFRYEILPYNPTGKYLAALTCMAFAYGLMLSIDKQKKIEYMGVSYKHSLDNLEQIFNDLRLKIYDIDIDSLIYRRCINNKITFTVNLCSALELF